ncbi:DUF2569 domain-containing protein [Providencia manganoxydans]|uniref:DUF2569 domain-containing protein n=1 Tax=Providencia manganoxydans TaxID=2923283 RepID=A0ABX7AFS8_9GAMM|nr:MULTISPECIES: DUF2569 domain-containing protein [Providencia]MDX4946613.1 DUF2569 domain-containing protein [Providencia manganoxydans]QQO62764.1 DUF2569 domain-containing protein [Providencia manganoxydans]HEF8771307.1 DUF2569 domain-containing protein [Providencia stuartii]
MNCNECNLVEANKASGLCDRCEQIEMTKINDVLYLPALGLIISLLVIPWELYHFTQVIFSYLKHGSFLNSYLIGAMGCLLLNFLITLYASWRFFMRKKGIRKVMITYYIFSLLASLYFTVIPTMLYGIQLKFTDLGNVISGIIGVVIWIPYFLLSNRINVVFTK